MYYIIMYFPFVFCITRIAQTEFMYVCVCVCVCAAARSGGKRNMRRLRQIIADKVAQRFFVLMAREIARLGTTAADERYIVILIIYI